MKCEECGSEVRVEVVVRGWGTMRTDKDGFLDIKDREHLLLDFDNTDSAECRCKHNGQLSKWEVVEILQDGCGHKVQVRERDSSKEDKDEDRKDN